ncbi:HTH-type transcriptional regulator/antitoxin PezA [Lysinibacillus parviboronicapiens]|uniref:HTH-type transcriptional regulator/antitoxin PezA n=1 Tax=Lysinibacillus parviboronicapiens TaxID=436516 RepID=A0ABV2PKS5_9BACI
MNNLQIGQLIRSLRKENNLSMSDLAQKLDISQASISRIESGIQEANYTLLGEICEQFGLTLSSFFLLLENKVDTTIKIPQDKFLQSENIDDELFIIIKNLSEEQKKGLYVLLLPYIR